MALAAPVLIITSFSLWFVTSFATELVTDERTYVTDTLPHLIYKDGLHNNCSCSCPKWTYKLRRQYKSNIVKYTKMSCFWQREFWGLARGGIFNFQNGNSRWPWPLLELTCHMGSHSVTCHPAEVTFQPLAVVEAGTQFSDLWGMQGWVDLVGTGNVPWWYTRPKTVTHPSTNWARRRVTSFMRRMTLTTTPRWQPVRKLLRKIQSLGSKEN